MYIWYCKILKNNYILILSAEEYSWINPTPQSVRLSRPLRIALEKEDETATIHEFQRLTNEINSLTTHNFEMSNNKRVTVKFQVSKTMFDGKFVNTITGNRATCRCPICLLTTHMFKLDDSFTPIEENLQYGLGLLHVEIKSFEHLLHLSYKLTIKEWDVTVPRKGNLVHILN